MSIDRRTALRGMLTAGAAGAVSLSPSEAREAPEPDPDSYGMLYDTTRCIGCKACVAACREANVETRGNPETETFEEGIWDAPMGLSGKTKNVIHLAKLDDGTQSYMKRQCMHCVDPACASACMIGALQKDENGVVTYDPAKCIGCRYCQVACPFQVPGFQYDRALPLIVKCELCRHRGYPPEGPGPACCEVCPRGAVIFGKRGELLAEAHKRLEEHPQRYEGKVYGEFEAGGTQVLYLSHVPFEEIGLPDLSEEPVPHVSETLQHGIYQGMIAPAALFVLLGGAVWRARRSQTASEEGEEEQS